MSTKFLYGASVQGIQGFIFQTNALREIAGASELVEQICTARFAQELGKNISDLSEDRKAMVTAAGNIKYVFEKEDDCKELVRAFPKAVMEFAPGITLSQAVIRIDDREVSPADLNDLEKRLSTQRNNPYKPIGLGLMAINRSRKSGLPAIRIDNEINKGKIHVDESLNAKRGNTINRICNAFFGDQFQLKKLPFEMEDITKSKGTSYSWLAIIHADGNDMGAIIQKIAQESGTTLNYQSIFRNFSMALDKSTKEAASAAYDEISKNYKLDTAEKYAFRPVVIGGDDLTVICRADLAVDFTQLFLNNFEKKTVENFKGLQIKALQNGLTACAGIAFIKDTYPFHYGYHLAEELCGHAKKEAKGKIQNNGLKPSCLMFHKVLDSFVESYPEIIKRELTASGIRLDFGPYYIHGTDPNKLDTLDMLNKFISEFDKNDGNAVKSNLRQWLSNLYKNKEQSEQKMERLISIGNKERIKGLKLATNKGIIANSKSPVFDWLTLISIKVGGN
ncbi:MAG: hypothetical protein Q8S18_11570 [Bacteroidales bacterium]|nr:hypothetical protein [Bacteroidales bacterium]